LYRRRRMRVVGKPAAGRFDSFVIHDLREWVDPYSL
jgi:hypothetical protein